MGAFGRVLAGNFFKLFSGGFFVQTSSRGLAKNPLIIGRVGPQRKFFLKTLFIFFEKKKFLPSVISIFFEFFYGFKHNPKKKLGSKHFGGGKTQKGGGNQDFFGETFFFTFGISNFYFLGFIKNFFSIYGFFWQRPGQRGHNFTFKNKGFFPPKIFR